MLTPNCIFSEKFNFDGLHLLKHDMEYMLFGVDFVVVLHLELKLATTFFLAKEFTSTFNFTG